MSRPKAAELRGLSKQELELKKDGLEKELYELRQQRITGQLEKPHFFKLLRRQIAQIKTVQNEKGTEAVSAKPAVKAEKAVKAAKAPAKTKEKAGKK